MSIPTKSESGSFAPIRLSVLDLVPIFGDAQPSDALEQAAVLAQTAERLGYVRYWASEHHDMPTLACPAPEVLLAHIGARTSRIRLGSGAVLLPHYKPLKVAESFHLLASLYPGRIDLGIGRAPGGTAHVSMALSGNFLEHVRQLPESLRSLTELLAGCYRYEDQPVTARPVPPVPPELWLLGTGSKSAAFAAELGAGYVFGQFMSDLDGAETLDAYRQAFHPSSLLTEPRVIVAVSVICAETEEEATRLVAAARAWFQPARSSEESAPPAPATATARKLYRGTPHQVKEQLQQLRIDCSIDELLVVTPIPDYKQRLRSYELLARAFT